MRCPVTVGRWPPWRSGWACDRWLWVQDGLLRVMAMASRDFAAYGLYLKNNSEKRLADAIAATAGIPLAPDFGSGLPNVTRALGGAT